MISQDIKLFEDVVEKINRCKLIGMSDIMCGNCLAKFLYDWYVEKSSALNMFRSIVYTYGRCILSFHRYSVNGKGDKLFYLSGILSDRSDSRKTFIKLARLSENRVIIIGDHKYHLCLSNLKYILLPLFWDIKLKKIIRNRLIRWNVIRVLLNGFISNVEIDKILKKCKTNINVLITYEDFTPESHILTQKFNIQGKKTIVIAHGAYSISNNVKEKFKYLCSQMMIVYSPYQEYVLRKTGTYKGKVVALGMPQFIGVHKKISGCQGKKVGVFLTGGILYRKSDKKLIDVAVEFCNKNNYDLVIKMHPGESEELRQKYINIISDRCRFDIIISEESSSSIEKKIKVMLCAIKDNTFTTCASEGAFLGIPVFLIGFGANNEIEQPVNCVIVNNERELQKLVETGNNEIQKKLRQYLCGSLDPTTQYKSFLNSL